MENLYIIAILVLIGYVALYLSGRKYLETFENRFHRDGSPVTDAAKIVSGDKVYPGDTYDSRDGRGTVANSFGGDTTAFGRGSTANSFGGEAPNSFGGDTTAFGRGSVENSFSSDTYEASAVYNNQGSKAASKKQLSDAMTRYPLDWSVQGPGSQVFQEGQAKYEAQQESNPSTVQPYEEQSTDMLLPDASTLEDEERKILQTYKPESSKNLLHYSVHDVQRLLRKLYGKKGLIPVIEKSKQGENVWEIVEVKEKNPTIVWEDDAVSNGVNGVNELDPVRQTMTDRGEDTIEVPYTASDIAAGLDPFMNKRNRITTGGYELRENTELDRMFQPTYPVPRWN